jgi:hypothetical protein
MSLIFNIVFEVRNFIIMIKYIENIKYELVADSTTYPCYSYSIRCNQKFTNHHIGHINHHRNLYDD